MRDWQGQGSTDRDVDRRTGIETRSGTEEQEQ